MSKSYNDSDTCMSAVAMIQAILEKNGKITTFNQTIDAYRAKDDGNYKDSKTYFQNNIHKQWRERTGPYSKYKDNVNQDFWGPCHDLEPGTDICRKWQGPWGRDDGYCQREAAAKGLAHSNSYYDDGRREYCGATCFFSNNRHDQRRGCSRESNRNALEIEYKSVEPTYSIWATNNSIWDCGGNNIITITKDDPDIKAGNAYSTVARLRCGGSNPPSYRGGIIETSVPEGLKDPDGAIFTPFGGDRTSWSVFGDGGPGYPLISNYPKPETNDTNTIIQCCNNQIDASNAQLTNIKQVCNQSVQQTVPVPAQTTTSAPAELIPIVTARYEVNEPEDTPEDYTIIIVIAVIIILFFFSIMSSSVGGVLVIS